ncbi:MAG: SGNH/GDSL hydrolase family protein [Clostridia bacterium]|nr:SGNH/GDSL hydrolase family protein [Clostridia bacterium]
MIKVGLLGDSIRLFGYGAHVPTLLGEKYQVFQPEDNCRFAKYMLRGLFDWRAELETCDVIHFNCGHWDVCELFDDGMFSSVEEYERDMLRVARILKSYVPKVIFATTTPVRDGYTYNKNENIKLLNESIVPKLQKMGIVINDLHALASTNVNKYICEEDLLHLSEEGSRLCAKQVADVIKKVCE